MRRRPKAPLNPRLPGRHRECSNSSVMHALRHLPLLAAATFVLSTAIAAHALTPEATCLIKTHAATAKVAKAQGDEAIHCLKARSKGQLDPDQTRACLLGDTRGRIAKARDKAAQIEIAKCGSAPGFGYTSAATASSAARTERLGLSDELFGPDMGAAAAMHPDDKAAANCQAAVAMATGKIVTQELRQFGKCMKSGLQAGTITDAAALESCVEELKTDPTGKIAKAKGRVSTALARRCTGVDLSNSFPGACGDADNPSTCLAARADCRTCLLLSDANDLGIDCDELDDGETNLSCIRCNGAASLCDRTFDEVAFPTSHNAMSNNAEGWLAPNNSDTVPTQLASGIRSLMLDTWYSGGNPVLCHGGEIAPGVGCNVTGQKPLALGLAELTAYLEANPHEVLSIIFESYISEADTAAAFATSGLLPYLHEQTLGAPWPSLRELITTGNRMIVFTDDAGASLPWHHYVWDHAWETPFSAAAPGDLSCSPNRGSTSNSLFIFNHFLTNPFASPALANTVNFNPFFLERAEQCQAESDTLPNFVTVDFEDIGDVYAVVRRLNGLP